LIPIAAVGGVVGLVPALMSVGATAISVAVAYFWLKYFEVHPVIPKVVLVLGGLAVLFGVYGAVMNAIHSFGAGSVHIASVDTASAEAAVAEARAMAANGALTPEAKKAIADAQKVANAALTPEAKRAVADAQKAAGNAVAAAAAAHAEAEKVAAADVHQAKATAPEPAHAAPPAPDPAPEPAKHATAPPPSEPEKVVPPTAPESAGSSAAAYQHYVQRRDAIEKMIAADPTLLTKNDEVLGLYKRIHNLSQNIRKGHHGGNIAPDDVVTQRLVEAETYEKTGRLVDDLYQRLMH
jgi:hypothetical protein